MTSDRQIAANQRNAQHSTGPITAAGKARSSQNAMTHGLLARQALLDDEDPERYHQFSAAFHDALQPQGGLEVHLVDRLANLAWRQQRFERIEADLLSSPALSAPVTVMEMVVRAAELGAEDQPVRAAQVLGDHFRAAQAQLMPLQRYEGQLGRDFARTLRQLRDLWADRALSAVKSLLSYAHRVGYVPFNVGAAVKLPKLKNTLAERILPESAVHRLIDR